VGTVLATSAVEEIEMPIHQEPLSGKDKEKRPAARAKMRLTSPAFADGATIPRRYTADGEDVSPPLTWQRGPDGTSSFALICEDPDAPSGLFVHWLIWNIDAAQLELTEDFADVPGGPMQGENGFGSIGWRGPSPPRGKPHRYVFRLYALDTKLSLLRGADRAALDRALGGHVLDDTLLIGMYGR
jgi:Raf kinase inhibitor-like YbhB/YbcL family protein